MLKPHTAKSRSGTATLVGINANTLEIFLSFLYSGDTSKVCGKAEELLEAADRYDVLDLIVTAARHLFRKVTVHNAQRLLSVAGRLSIPWLKETVLDFATRNVVELVATVGACAECAVDDDAVKSNGDIQQRKKYCPAQITARSRPLNNSTFVTLGVVASIDGIRCVFQTDSTVTAFP